MKIKEKVIVTFKLSPTEIQVIVEALDFTAERRTTKSTPVARDKKALTQRLSNQISAYINGNNHEIT